MFQSLRGEIEMSEPWDLPPDHPEAKPTDSGPTDSGPTDSGPTDSGPTPTPSDAPPPPDADTPAKVDRPTEHIQQHQGAPHSAHEPPQGEPATEHIPQQAQPTQKVNRRSAYSEPRSEDGEAPEPRQQTQRQPAQPAPQPAPHLQPPPARQQRFHDDQCQRHPGQTHYHGPPRHPRNP